VAEDKPDIVSLPEVWDSLGGGPDAAQRQCRNIAREGVQRTGREAYEFMRETARRHNVHVHGGSIIEKGPEKLSIPPSCSIPTEPSWRATARCTCFDIVAPDGTGYKESNTYGAGDEVVTYQAGDITVGCAICYDIRFRICSGSCGNKAPT